MLGTVEPQSERLLPIAAGDRMPARQATEHDGRYILEDHGGYPIECPICGHVDRWLARAGALGTEFACVHPPEAGPHGVRRRVAVVQADQVGASLAWASLLSSAA